MNDNTRKTKIAEMATVLLAAHLGVPASIVSVDIHGIDVLLGRRYVQVKVARSNGGKHPVVAARVTAGQSGMRRANLTMNISAGQSRSGKTSYGPRSKADLYVFVSMDFAKPFQYEFWVATAREVAHAKSGVAMRDEWRLERRMRLFRGRPL